MTYCKKTFIEFCLKKEVLIFGDFQLKSGRNSPYFFNSSCFYTGKDIYKLGSFYAQKIIELKLNYTALLGLTYKGIPIVTSISCYLKNKYNINVPFYFNRKEIKEHGECGYLIGKNFNKNIIIIDDVVTAGTAINNIINYINKINNKKTKISAIIVALDRQESGITKTSAIKQIESKNNCTVISLITINDIIQYLYNIKNMKKYLIKLQNYRLKYGVTS